MPDPSIWGPLLGLILVFALLGPIVAGLSILFTKHPRTRYFWIFGAVCAVIGGWWLSTLVKPERVFDELFGEPPSADVVDLDYELDRHAHQGVFCFRVRASSKSVDRIIRWRILQPVELPAIDTLIPEDLNRASWWPPPWIEKAEVYHVIGSGPRYKHLEEWLFLEPDGDEVQYMMVGRLR